MSFGFGGRFLGLVLLLRFKFFNLDSRVFNFMGGVLVWVDVRKVGIKGSEKLEKGRKFLFSLGLKGGGVWEERGKMRRGGR